MATRLDTRDVDDARVQVSRSYCPHELLPQRATAFHARHAEGGAGDLAVFTLSWGAGPVRVQPVPFGDFVLVSRPLTGHLTVGRGRSTVVVGRGESVALDPRTEHRLDFGPGCRLLTIKLPCAVLDRVGAGSIHTGRPRDSTAWDAVTRFVVHEVLPHGLLASPVGSGVVTLVATAVLDAFGTAPVQTAASDRGRAAAVRAACRYIEERAHDGIGVADIAAAAGVRPRTLQEHFHAELGRSPMAQLRDVRLRRVHAELTAGTAATVAEAAYRWGFGNLGRFAAEYRRLFGRLPAADLRR